MHMHIPACLHLGVVVSLFATSGAAAVVRVKDGRVHGGAHDGEWVGTHTSELASNVVWSTKYFANVTEEDWEATSHINRTTLRYLVLEGSYLADVPLRLPSLFVLQLQTGTIITPCANLTLDNTTTFTALVEMVDVHFSAVVGGTIDASSLPASALNYPDRSGYMAVAIKGGSNNAIRGIVARANNSDGALGVNQSPHAEVAFCDVGGGAAGQGVAVGRCIWCLATSHALVHDNWVRNCSAHALDFDAYTSTSAAYNNVCEDNGEEGIFVEVNHKLEIKKLKWQHNLGFGIFLNLF